MDLSTLMGLAFGLALIVGSIIIGGNWRIFLNLNSIMIVLGGTLAGTIVNYSLPKILELFRYTRRAFTKDNFDPTDVIEIMVGFAEKARREGLLALEDEAAELDNEFLKKGIQLVVDGTDPELVKNIMVTKLSFLESSDLKYQNMYKTMATLSPAFGMIGTLIGLIKMLTALDNPDLIAGGMGEALITTLYGSFLANYLFIPLAGKLQVRSSREIVIKELMIEGLLSIQAGENPRIVEEKLRAFLDPKEETTGSARDEELEMAVGRNA